MSLSIAEVNMRYAKLAIPLLAVNFLMGCEESPSVVSLHPIYDERTVTFEPALVGAWSYKEKSDERWTFKKAPDDNTYRLEVIETSKDKTMIFDAVLVRLGGSLFMDLCSENTGETGAPAHAILKLRLEETKLELQEINNKWLAERAASEGLPYLKTHTKVVLTAPTLDVQYFLQHHGSDAGAFPEDSPDLMRLSRIVN
jgi:hypothetical protein